MNVFCNIIGFIKDADMIDRRLVWFIIISTRIFIIGIPGVDSCN